MEPTNWAPEHSDALREHLAEGMSFSAIAKAINSRFNTTYSRNAALGRATRMGLTGEVRSKSPSDDRPAIVQGIGESRPTESRMPAFWPVPVFKAVKPKKLRCVKIEPRHLSLTDLARRLPVSLRRRRRGRGHHVLRPPAPRRFELLHATFPFKPHPDPAAGVRGE